MHKALYVTAASLAALTVLYYGWGWLSSDGGPGSPEQLADQALQAPTRSEQVRAALALGSCQGAEARPHMQRVFMASTVPDVRAAMIQGLVAEDAYEYMTLLLDALDDPDPWVRGRAGVAVQRLLEKRYDFKAEDSAAQRAPIVQAMRNDWEKVKGTRLSGSPYP